MKEITSMELHLYKEELPKQWWDGQLIEVLFGLGSANKIAAAFGDAELHQEIHNELYLGKEYVGILSSFRLLKNQVLVHYPFFGYYSLPPKCSGPSTTQLTLYKDCHGYGAHIENGELICYHPLMLPPFQNQTGYCIGALMQSELIFPQPKNIAKKCYLTTTKQLCANVDWQHLVRFAKPYNDYFAAANVKKIPSEVFYYRKQPYGLTVPLYLGDQCVAVYLNKCGYISYTEYLEKFL